MLYLTDSLNCNFRKEGGTSERLVVSERSRYGKPLLLRSIEFLVEILSGRAFYLPDATRRIA